MRTWNWPSIAVAAPASLLAAGLAGALVAAAVGRSPIWPDHHVNLAEAIAASDEGEIVRLMAAGADVNESYDVHSGLTFDRFPRVTPLEAAVLSHRADLIDRLVREGALIDSLAWNRLRCLATGEGMIAALERHRPVDAAGLGC